MQNSDSLSINKQYEQEIKILKSSSSAKNVFEMSPQNEFLTRISSKQSVTWNAPNVVELKLPELDHSRQYISIVHPESSSNESADKKNFDIIAKLNSVKAQ